MLFWLVNNMSVNEDFERTIKTLSIVSYFKELDIKILKLIAGSTIRKNYQVDQVVLLGGELCKGLSIVDEGCLKVVKSSTSGREQVLRIVGTGETFGETGMFAGSINPATVIALEESTVLQLKKESLFGLIKTNPEISIFIIKNLSMRNLYFVNMIEDLSLRTVESRLARYILDSGSEDFMTRQPWATQAELASRLGTVLDVLNRALHSLVTENLIKLERRYITILNRDGLKEKAMIDV